MDKLQLEVFIEEDRGLWGYLKYKSTMLLSHGNDLTELEHKLKNMLIECEGVPPTVSVVFECRYGALPYPEY